MIFRNNSTRVFYCTLPESAHGVCAKESDNEYIIIINSSMTTEEQIETLLHELTHIENNDFSKPENRS